MKYFQWLILAFVVLGQTLADDKSDMDQLGNKAKEIMEKCAKMTDVKLEQLRTIMRLEKLTEKPLKCFLACMAKEMEFMKNDNTFDKRKITTTLKPFIDTLNKENREDVSKKINLIIEICVPLQKGSGDECAAAREAYECITENAQKLELLPKGQK